MNILDNFNAKINYKFEDDEIYELMQKYKDNEEAILNELNEELKEREKRGDEYEWHDVGKSNYNYIFNIFLIIDGKVEKKKEEDNNYEGKYYTSNYNQSYAESYAYSKIIKLRELILTMNIHHEKQISNE